MFFRRLSKSLGIFFRLFKVIMQVAYGVWRLFKLPQPFVSIFGGARLSQESPYAVQADDLARRFVEHNISVITGGGSGVMHAANCGAIAPKKEGSRSIGIGVKDLGEGRDPCVQEYFQLDYFFARKWLLTRYSIAFVVFPGGFGTMDELAEILTLIHTNKLARVPIILVGTDYWKHFMSWITDSAFSHNLIPKEDLKLFTVTDDLDEAFCIVRDECHIGFGKTLPK